MVETTVVVSRCSQLEFCGLGIKGSVSAVLTPINNLLVCVHRKIVIRFAEVSNVGCKDKDCSF